MKAKFRKIRKSSVIALSMVAVMLFALLTPVDVSAASKRPFKDVTVKKVGKVAYNSIKVTKKYGVWKGIVKTKGKKKNKFEKKKAMKVKDCFKAWKNDKRIPKKYIHIAKADKKIWNKTATCGWVYAKYSAMAKEMYQVGKWGLLWDTSYKDKTKVNRLRFAIISAAVKDPYTDVTKKNVSAARIGSAKYVKAHGGTKNVFNGKKLGPYNYITKGQNVNIAINLRGRNKIPTKYLADISSNEPATFGWFCQMISDLCLIEGIKINWSRTHPDEEKMTRIGALNLWWKIATVDKRLMPRQ